MEGLNYMEEEISDALDTSFVNPIDSLLGIAQIRWYCLTQSRVFYVM